LDSVFLVGGGFAGWIEDSQIDLCGAEGAVLGNLGVSGFAFYIANSEITRCYTSGLVGGNKDPEQLGALPLFTGGFAFEISSSTLSDNYFAGQMEETQNNGGAGLGGDFVFRSSNAAI